MRRTVAALGLVLLWPALAQAQSLPDLACAAALHCGDGRTPEAERARLGHADQASAEQAFVDASQDWPDAAWRCAASGAACRALTPSEARVVIGLADEAYAPAEALRQRAGVGGSADVSPPSAPVAPPPRAAGPDHSPIRVEPVQPTREQPAAPGRIAVEVVRPGPPEVELAPEGGGIQPQDGFWEFRYAGKPRAGKGCLPGVADAAASGMPGPMSGDIHFQRPFHPRQLMPATEMDWQSQGANRWRGQLPGSNPMMQLVYELSVISESRIGGAAVVEVSVPSPCRIETPLVFERRSS